MFKFLNCVTKKDGFHDMVRNSWNQGAYESPMQRLWFKLKRLQHPIRTLQKEYSGLRCQHIQARDDLENAQKLLQSNMFDKDLIDLERRNTEKVLDLNQREESILRQKAKAEWLRLGDGNNSFFHNSLNERNKHNNMHTLNSLRGEVLRNKDDIEKEVIEF